MGNKKAFKRKFISLFACFTSHSLRRLPSGRSFSSRRAESKSKIKPEPSLPASSPKSTSSHSPYRRKVSHLAPLPNTSPRNHYRMGTEEREESLKDVIEYCKIFGHVPPSE